MRQTVDQNVGDQKNQNGESDERCQHHEQHQDK